MSATVSDQHQRDQALDTTLSCIVQAPAGSGKTELLSQRYLALLAKCDKPENVLAITFTRKAASEMRARIIGALESALQEAPGEAHKLKTWQLAKTAMQADQANNWQILKSPARLKIVTIDSLNASLARQMPILSNMGVIASPVDNARPLYAEAARRTLAEVENGQYTQELSLLLLHLGNNSRRIQELLISMLAKRDQWLRHLLKPDNSRDILEQSLHQLIEDHLQALQQALPAGFIDALSDLALFAANNIESGKNPVIESWLSYEDTRISAQPQHLPAWQGLAELLLTKDGSLRKSVTKNIGFPAASGAKDAAEKDLFNDKKQQLQNLIQELADDTGSVVLLDRLRSMPALTYSDNQWQLLEALTRVLVLSAMQLKVVFGEQGQVDFSEIAMAALDALDSDRQPTELAMILDYELQHILVDEFQDTSHGQFKLLELLTREWQPDDGRTLFLVGDPMQSIYRFREAEVGLYLRARAEGIGNRRLTPLHLDVNFRSQQGIVDWINTNLVNAFAAQEDIGTGAVCYSPSTPFNPLLDGQAVQLHAGVGRDDTEEASSVCALVRQQLDNDADSKVAILVRSRNHLSEIINQLKHAGIPFQAVDLDPLNEQPAVIDLYTLTRSLTHFADRLYWLALLRAPWCGLQLADLLVLANGPSAVIWNNCLNKDLQPALSDSGREHLQLFITRIKPFIDNRGRMTFKQWLEAIWQQLGGNSIYSDRNSREAVERYLHLLDNYQQGGYLTDLQAFDEALDNLYASPDRLADDRVQLMTIHKSKGLEFDTVILPGLGKAGKNDDIGLLEWLERPNRHGEPDLLLSPIKASGDNAQDAISKSLRVINQEKAGHELTRLLYVAMTRAKNQLHLFAHAGQDRKGNLSATANSLLSIIWQELSPAFDGMQANEPEQSATKHDIAHKLTRLTTSWQAPAYPALSLQHEQDSNEEFAGDNIEFEWAGDTARFIGTVTHNWLEYLATTDKTVDTAFVHSSATAIRAELRKLGTDPDEIDSAAGRVIQALTNTLEDQTGRWILDKHEQAQSEYALTSYTNNKFRQFIIDRTFIDTDGTRWIIDYKTGNHEGSDIENFLQSEQERYRPQLENYAYLISQMEQRPIRLGLYFPLFKAWKHWEFMQSS